uniref:Uncharacterized protein n=1 Tax=Rhizophora mucronata TaxID=61149 RepID=A0A2P2JAU7_RHIMU
MLRTSFCTLISLIGLDSFLSDASTSKGCRECRDHWIGMLMEFAAAAPSRL